MSTLELLVRQDGARTLLCAPGVGWFRGARAGVLAPGDSCGELETLGARVQLLVPAGAAGRIVSKPPARLRAPVEYGEVLYELAPLDLQSPGAPGASGASGASGARGAGAAAGGEDVELRVPAPQSGRFWHRTAPGEPVLCAPGRELETGTPLGLIEVMKTFTHVVYRPERGLPPRARIARVLVADGADVEEGAPLVVVAP